MPGPFSHIYAARRVADHLRDGHAFLLERDGEVQQAQQLDAHVLGDLTPKRCAELMDRWPRHTALGAVGPDLFFFCQDYAKDHVPSDEIMLAMAALYLVDDAGRDDWEPFLAILEGIDGTWAQVVRFLIKLEKIWSDFVEVWQDTVGRVTDAVGEVIDDMSGGMLSALGDAIAQLGKALLALCAEELVTFADIFGWFSLGMRKGFDEQLFLWSDMLHYRRTSDMARNLVKQADALRRSDEPGAEVRYEQFLAYALGWVCHIGVDTTAHAFVNEQAGGPFRTHWQRHHLVENHIDAWNYHQTGGATPGLTADADVGATDAFPSLNQSALYFAVQFDDEQPLGDPRPTSVPRGKDRASAKARKEALDTDGELPPWMAAAIVQAMIDTYGEVEHPGILQGSAFQRAVVDDPTAVLGIVDDLTDGGMSRPVQELLALIAPSSDLEVPPGFPLPWEVQVCYRFMLTFFKRSFNDSLDLDKPKRPTIFTPPASDFDFPGPPDLTGPGGSDDPVGDVCDGIKALADWIERVLEKAAQAAYDLAKSAASAGTYPAREAIYELVTLPAWCVVENVRRVLTHTGLLMPQDEGRYDDGELARPNEIDLELITLGHAVDGAFTQALADNIDVFGNLDRDPELLGHGVHNPKDARYPYYPVRDHEPDQEAGGWRAVGDPQEFRRPWAHPDLDNALRPNGVEGPPTIPGPYPVGARPDVLFRTTGRADNAQRLRYEQASSPAVTDRLNTSNLGHDPDGADTPLGDPIMFSTYLIGQLLGNPSFGADFNLDADRGHAYLCWDWDRRDDTVDGPRGKTFRACEQWPEGADWPGGNTWAGEQAQMHLHYVERPGHDQLQDLPVHPREEHHP